MTYPGQVFSTKQCRSCRRVFRPRSAQHRYCGAIDVEGTCAFKHERSAMRRYNRAYRQRNGVWLTTIKREYQRQYPERNREGSNRYRLNHPERRSETVRRWKDANPHKNKLYKYRRRVNLQDRGTHTAEEWETLKQLCGCTCLMCGRSEPVIRLTEDHIVPLSKGGMNTIDNIQPLCLSCNSKKRDREWFASCPYPKVHGSLVPLTELRDYAV